MKRDERRRLIDALVEDRLSESDFLRLEAELAVDAEARRDYYDRVALSMLLENEMAQRALVTGAENVPAATPVRRWRRAFAVMAVVSVLLLVINTLQWTRSREQSARNERIVEQQPSAEPRSSVGQPLPETARQERAVSGYAVVSGQSQAVWADGLVLNDGALVPAGQLRLESGLIQLELFSGVLLVLEGEAEFSIESPMEVAVKRGKVRAQVPEPAQGFRLRTSAGEVVDLGTEFALDVNDLRSELHVLDGEVEWLPEDARRRRIARGSGLRLSAGGRQEDLTAREADFVGPDQLRERLRAQVQSRRDRWLSSSRQLRDDPRLVALYQVAESDLLERRLPNLASESPGSSGEGAIVAAAPAPDRWGRPDSALDFSPAGSRVRLTVPGEHRSLTFVCWVRINSLDRWYNSLFLTDGHEQGEPHWQIMDDGRLFFSVKKRDVFDRSRGESDKHIYFSPPFWTSELSGQWLMIATVYDVDARRVTHYLNGDILSREAMPEEYVVESVRIGNASIANWGLPKRNEPRFAVRNLNGSLDEFILFSAALTDTEMRKLYDDGKP